MLPSVHGRKRVIAKGSQRQRALQEASNLVGLCNTPITFMTLINDS